MAKFTKEMVDDYAEKLSIGLTEEENQMVLDELSQFVRGSKDKESSVSSLSEKIKIYMSE